jgi:phosphate ABC transporter permease protein PstC/phosphate ABC transporter permease subunit PstA
VSFGIAMFLTELSPVWLRRPLGTAIEMLAAIPSIIYGMWGLFIFAPLFQQYVQPYLKSWFGGIPGIGVFFSGPPMGIGLLTAGIILAVMVIPFITAVMRDVFELVPPMLKESAYGLGSTTWEVVWRIVLPFTKVGVIGGIMLGLGRALGETMAVTFVIGNAHRLSASLLAPGNSIASALANEFTEAVGDLYTSALIELGLILFLITTVVLALAKLLLMQLAPRRGGCMSIASANSVYRRRRRTNALMMGLSGAALAFGLFWLTWIIAVLLWEGASALRPSLFTQMTPPPGGDGGLANAIVGSILMAGIGTLIGTPVGILAGTYLAEYGRRGWLAPATRFINDVLLSAPSIVIGLFVYAVYVAQAKHFSGWAGSLALSIIVIPVVVRTTDDMLKLVPNSLREAAARWAATWKMITMVSAGRTASSPACARRARIAGETAPLLFTALNNQFWSSDMNRPMANLPVVIFQFAMSPYEDWHRLAWGGAALITLLVLGINIAARALFSRR